LSAGEHTLTDQPLEFTVELDCASADTFSGEGGMYTFRTLHVSEAGRYLLWTNAGGMTLRPCEDEPELIAPTFSVFDDGLRPTSTIPFYGFEGGKFRMFRLEPGEHLISVAVDSWTDAHEFTVRIEPAPPIVMVP
jgi:hypothetical protein